MFSWFNQSKLSTSRLQEQAQKEPLRFRGTIINPSSVSNEEFFMLLQEIGDLQSEEQMDSSNVLSLQNGQIQIQFNFLSKLNPYEKQNFSTSDIIMLLLQVDENDVSEQFKYIEDYLHYYDENCYEKKNSQAFFFIQNFQYKIHENNEFEFQISELLTQHPHIINCKVSSDNKNTLNQLLIPKILKFTQQQDQQQGWSPINTSEQDQFSLQKTSRNVLDQLDQYKQTRQTSQSPPPQSQRWLQSQSPPPLQLQPRQSSNSPPPPQNVPLKSKKSIFENPLIAALKQQQEDKKIQEELMKSQQDNLLQLNNQFKSSSNIFSNSNYKESPEQSLISRKRDTNQSLIYYNSSNKKFENDSPLSTLRFRDEEKEYNHQIKVKMSPFRQEITTNYTYPKLSGEKQPPIFKTSLVQGDNQDYLIQNIARKISRSNSPKNQQISQQQKEGSNTIKQFNNQNFLDVSINKQNLDKSVNKSEIKLNKYSEIPRSITPTKFQNQLNSNQQQQNELRRNKSTLGIRQSNTIIEMERSKTPNKQNTKKLQKQIVTPNVSSQNCILKLNVEIQNKIVQLEVEEHDTPHTLTYKLLQQCNSSGQLKQVKQISQMIEQKLKKYLQNVEKYFKNQSKPQITYTCKQNKQILQELIDNDYQEVQKKKKLGQNSLYQGLDRSYQKFTNISNQDEINNRPSSALTAKNNCQQPQIQQNILANKYIGEIQIQGNVNGKLQNISMMIEENTQPDVQASQFLIQNNLSLDLKDQICQQIQQIIAQHKQVNTYSEIFQENREQISFIKELKSKYRFDNNVLFQSIQKSQAKINHFRVNLELESGKIVKFNFNDTDNLAKAINIFCINHKLSSKNQQKLYNICQQSIKYYKELNVKKRQQ